MDGAAMDGAVLDGAVPASVPASVPVSAPLYEVKANLFKGLSHPLRIRILEIIVREGEVAVAQLLAELDMEASHLSQHLAVLRRHHLVRSQRRASSVFYYVTYPEVAELLASARKLLALVVAESPESPAVPTAPASLSAPTAPTAPTTPTARPAPTAPSSK